MNMHDVLTFVLIVNFVIGGISVFSDDFLVIATDEEQTEAMNSFSSTTSTVLGASDQAVDESEKLVTGGAITQMKMVLANIRTFIFGLPTLITKVFNPTGANTSITILTAGVTGILIFKMGIIILEGIRGFKVWS